MRRSIILAAAALSTAAVGQVGTEVWDGKIPDQQLPGDPSPTATPQPAASPTPMSPSTDDAPPSDRADSPAGITPAPGDPTDASAPPPKR